jgi:hypothetical protein
VLGPKPERTASLTGYPSSEERFRQIADELWPKESNPNKKRIKERVGTKEALATMNVLPDCAWDGNDDAYGYIHRRTTQVTSRKSPASDAEIYFVSNRKEEAARETFRFRVTEKQPELWNPLTGSIRPAKAFRQHDGVTELPLAFEPY